LQSICLVFCLIAFIDSTIPRDLTEVLAHV
jgi:hypothetical protein